MSGMKQAERRPITLHLKRGGEQSATLVTDATKGPQTLLLSFGGDLLEAGDYTLEATVEGGSGVATQAIRVVSSPWE